MPSTLPGYTSNLQIGNYSTPTSAFDVSTPGGVSAVTEYINRLNRQAQTQANRNRIPGSQALEDQSSRNIGSELRGEVQADVIRLLGQQAAERGLATGQGAGGPNTMAAYLQALGLTSIGQMHQGQQDLTAAYARNPGAPLFDPSTQLMTPFQQGQLRLQATEAQDRARAERARIDLERSRIATEAETAANRYRAASGGGGPGYAPAGIHGPAQWSYGGEVVAPSLSNDIITGRSESENYVPWWQTPNYSGPTTTGTGTYYAGSNTDPNAWMDQFWSDFDQGTSPGGTTTATSGVGGLPGEDFVLNGYIGSDAPPVDIGG